MNDWYERAKVLIELMMYTNKRVKEANDFESQKDDW